MVTVCFTGHRKLGGKYYNKSNPSTTWYTLEKFMCQVIRDLITIHEVDHFISGLAIGVDMLGAECVALVRAFTPQTVKLTGAMPFPSQPNRWPQMARNQWDNVCGLCNELIEVSPDPYSPEKMQVRNKWMVDRSNYVIAVWNGEKHGGTWNCMEYVRLKGKPILGVKPMPSGWRCAWI